MEIFSDHWLLWTCFLVPALLWLRLEKMANVPIRFGVLAGFVAVVAGMLLAMGLIHLAVEALLS